MTGKCFFDSNVWIYLLSDDEPAKKEQAGRWLSEVEQKVVSWQVVNEVCANLLKKKSKSESFVRVAMDFICESCEVVDFSLPLLETASELRARHGVSFWDSLVVAAAHGADCDTIVSEDMQDGRKFGQMVVRNIFK